MVLCHTRRRKKKKGKVAESERKKNEVTEETDKYVFFSYRFLDVSLNYLFFFFFTLHTTV